MESHKLLICFVVHIVLLLHWSSAKLSMLTYKANQYTVLSQILLDEFGSVYVGGTNVLYKFRPELVRLDKVQTGPWMDADSCPPDLDSVCKDRRLTNNEAVVLEQYPKGRYLLFCGTVKQGLCGMYSMDDFSANYMLNESNPLNFLGSRKSTYVFFGEGFNIGSDRKTLYTGISYDERPMQYATVALSSRVIEQSKDGIYDIKYSFQGRDAARSRSAVDIDAVYKATYPVRYIYAFQHQGFSYFVTVQRGEILLDGYQTRVARVCQNDPSFYSYTEVHINCRKTYMHSTFYNIAQDAYLSTVGDELASRFNFAEGEQVLFVAFGKSDPGMNIANSSFGYGMCMYTMKDIRAHFTRVQTNCYMGYGHHLLWINSQFQSCIANNEKAKQIQEQENFCGSKENTAIGSRYPMDAYANITSDECLATSLRIVKTNGKTVAVVGTHNGYVIKVLVNGTNTQPYARINVAEGATVRSISKDVAMDHKEYNLYVLTGNRVTRIPIQSCRVHSGCSECITMHDPLNCGWCGDHCSTRSECRSAVWMQNSCPPLIYSFEPHSGPVQGGTRITIMGHNFGTSELNAASDTAMVQVALIHCVIEYRNSTSILCRTGKSVKEIEREVKVTVVDRSKSTVPYIIQGDATSGLYSFHYKRPRVHTFFPSTGPRSGGTYLTILGENLDIGSNTYVQVQYLPCNIIQIVPSMIVCITSEWTPELDLTMLPHIKRDAYSSNVLLDGSVNVTIDSANLSDDKNFFHYKEDPKVYRISPRASVMSGGQRITVQGTNLDVIHQPKIIATIKQDRSRTYNGNCTALGDGNVMYCNSPTINSSYYKMDDRQPLDAEISFLMDNVQELVKLGESDPSLSAFKYFIDPVLDMFVGYEYTYKFYEDDIHMTINGNYMYPDIASDIIVTVGETKCNITQVSVTMIICEPEKPGEVENNHSPLPVVVKIGYFKFQVGYLRYSQRDPSILLVQVLGPLMGTAVVIFILVILCWMKKTERGPFKKNHLHDATVRYTRGDMVHIGREGNGNALYRLNHVENPYCQQGRIPNQQVRHRSTNGGDLNVFDDESRRLIEDAHLLIRRDNIILCDVIGQGHFGCVFRGFMTQENQKEEVEVAVKTLKNLAESHYISSEDGRKFLEEALRMRDFDHVNILTLIGIALDKDVDMPLVVLPFMRHGDLLSYIRDEGNSPTVKELMDFGIQVARGMAYLANLKFVHRDLAARNCMLDDMMNVKVADFGLSRDIYERDYYSSDDRKAKLPVKWMAIESLEKGIYNNKTDVWSYGVVLWELMTRGVCPYPEVDNWDIIKYLKSGRRMPQPSYCPDQLYAIMLECWNAEPTQRPAFADLVHRVEIIIQNMLSAHENVGLNASYVNVPTSQAYLYPQTTLVQASSDGAALCSDYDHNVRPCPMNSMLTDDAISYENTIEETTVRPYINSRAKITGI